MENMAVRAIQTVLQGKKAFCKFLSANDSGETKAHQRGILISKKAADIMFDRELPQFGILDRWTKIEWQDGSETDSRFIYYSSKKELRITNFSKGFPFLRPDQTGSLFILVKFSDEFYQAFFLDFEDEINQFLEAFGISPTETNRLITAEVTSDIQEELEINNFIASLTEAFPASEVMARAAQDIQNRIYNRGSMIISKPDLKLIAWTDMEYKIFRALERSRYGSIISEGFPSVDAFINMANQVLNRRKSRAGKSLEHHLEAVFRGNSLEFQTQAVTEENKKPDFLFPSAKAYHDSAFPVDKLVFLAAKTTCKDRWRQILNEADRLRSKTKFLCTLQQGISEKQLAEMQAENVVLVVPEPYIRTYPGSRQSDIWTLRKFVCHVKELEGRS